MLSAKDSALVFLQGQEQDHTKDTAGYDLTCAYRQAVVAKTLQDGHAVYHQAIAVDQHKRHDDRVGCDRAYRGAPFPSTERISTKCTEQSCQTAENNVGQRASCQNIAEQTADKEAGNGSRGEIRQNRECLGEPNLHGIVGKSESVGDKGQHNVDGGDHGRLNQGGQ